MSWLARSIANTLRLDDDDVDAQDNNIIRLNGSKNVGHLQNDAVKSSSTLIDPCQSHGLEEVDLDDRIDNRIGGGASSHYNQDNRDNCGDHDDDDDDRNQGRGVREDLSEFKQTLTRQLWGVASFLAPPPPPPPPPLPRRSSSFLKLDRGKREEVQDSSDEVSDEEGHFPEFPEDFRPIGVDVEEEDDVAADAVGITEEALAFAQNIAHHPETWLDFPLSEEDECDDFEISDSQDRHAQAIEHLAPRLAALRRELCPVHMSQGYFWMVYFVLLYSRLKKQDADALSTPQLVNARAMWMQELQKKTKPEPHMFARETYHSKESTFFTHENLDYHAYDDPYPNEYDNDKHASDIHAGANLFDSPTIREDVPSLSRTTKEDSGAIGTPSYKAPIQDFDEEDDDWLEDTSDLEGYTGNAMNMMNEEDVSFSDLEDDLDCTMPLKSKSSIMNDYATYSKTS